MPYLTTRKNLKLQLSRGLVASYDMQPGNGVGLFWDTTYWVRPVSSLCRTRLMPQLQSYCVSGSSTTSPLTFEIDYIGCWFSRDYWIQSVCRGVQVSASGCTNIPRWTVLTGVWISQSWSPPFSCWGWPCSSTLQNNEIRPKMFCCFWSNTLELTPIVCVWSITDTDSVLQDYQPTYSLRSASHDLLATTRPRSVASLAFRHSAATTWNSFNIRNCDTVVTFKRRLKTFLFNQVFAI